MRSGALGWTGGRAVIDVRIEDLREPRRDATEQQVYEMALGMQVDLDPAGAGRRRRGVAPGCTDFGDPTLLDRLDAQVRAVEADTGLSGLGRFLIRRRLVGLLAARLRFEDYVRRHPEALEVELEPPVIVVGLPRSGTTAPGEPAGDRRPVPIDAVVGGRRADPGDGRRSGP